MKTKQTSLYIAFICSAFLGLTSCEIANELDDFDPLYVLDAEIAIKDPATAELALTGTYSKYQSSFDARPFITTLPSVLSISAVNSVYSNDFESQTYAQNNPLPENRNLLGVYTHLYEQINRSNWVIEKVSQLTDKGFAPNRRTEIIAEAKAIRAHSYFDLLRLFGQFYDLGSEYGVSLRLAPAKNIEYTPRASVNAVYQQILSDLDTAIQDAPELRGGHKYFMNKTFAKALKAKLYLYMGKYSEAASLAHEVMTSSGSNFGMTPTFQELFDHSTIATLDNSESLFVSYHSPAESSNNNVQWFFSNSVSPDLIALGKDGFTDVAGQKISYDGNRVSGLLGFNDINSKYANLFLGDAYDTTYFLRMAEVYLIFAEADARARNSVSTEALTALNAIRVRAGASSTGGDGFETYPAAISINQFLTAVRIEKLMELATETGEDWFDLIRYDHADGFGSGFKVSDVKASAVNPDKFIMPIPAQSIQTNKGAVKQNPGY